MCGCGVCARSRAGVCVSRARERLVFCARAMQPAPGCRWHRSGRLCIACGACDRYPCVVCGRCVHRAHLARAGRPGGCDRALPLPAAEFDADRCTHYVTDSAGEGCTGAADVGKLRNGTKCRFQVVSPDWVSRCIRWAPDTCQQPHGARVRVQATALFMFRLRLLTSWSRGLWNLPGGRWGFQTHSDRRGRGVQARTAPKLVQRSGRRAPHLLNGGRLSLWVPRRGQSPNAGAHCSWRRGRDPGSDSQLHAPHHERAAR